MKKSAKRTLRWLLSGAGAIAVTLAADFAWDHYKAYKNESQSPASQKNFKFEPQMHLDGIIRWWGAERPIGLRMDNYYLLDYGGSDAFRLKLEKLLCGGTESGTIMVGEIESISISEDFEFERPNNLRPLLLDKSLLVKPNQRLIVEVTYLLRLFPGMKPEKLREKENHGGYIEIDGESDLIESLLEEVNIVEELSGKSASEKSKILSKLTPWSGNSVLNCVLNADINGEFTYSYPFTKIQMIPGVKLYLPGGEIDPESIKGRVLNPILNPESPLNMELQDPFDLIEIPD